MGPGPDLQEFHREPQRVYTEISYMRALASLLLLLAGVFTLGCARDDEAELLRVLELSPHEVEPHDMLELSGEGLPHGHKAKVTFVGTLHRPGEPPVEDFSARLEGVASRRDAVEIAMTDDVIARFCGPELEASHAAFVGDVEVAFASSTPGAPPVVGTLRGATLQLRPAAGMTPHLAALSADGARLVAFLGIERFEVDGTGLTVGAVAERSRAAEAGLVPGVTIERAGALSVGAVSDLAAPVGDKLQVTLRFPSGERSEASLDLSGYVRPRLGRESTGPLLGLAAAFAVLLGLFAPLGSRVAAVEHRFAQAMLRAARARGTWASSMRRGARFLVLGATSKPLAPIAAFSGLTMVLATSATTGVLVGPDLDVFVLLGAQLTATLACLFVGRARGAWATRVPTVLLALAIAWVSILALLYAAGDVRVAELVSDQHRTPLGWAALRSPVALLALSIYVVASTAAVELCRCDAPLAGTFTAKAAIRRETPTSSVLSRVAWFSTAALVVLVGLGGWGASVDGRFHAGATSVLLVKQWGVLASLAWLATAVGRSFSSLVALVVRTLLPAAVVSVGLVALFRARVAEALVAAPFRALLLFAVALVLARAVHSVRRVASSLPHEVDPFA